MILSLTQRGHGFGASLNTLTLDRRHKKHISHQLVCFVENPSVLIATTMSEEPHHPPTTVLASPSLEEPAVEIDNSNASSSSSFGTKAKYFVPICTQRLVGVPSLALHLAHLQVTRSITW